MAGLAATKVLRQDGFDVTAFERNRQSAAYGLPRERTPICTQTFPGKHTPLPIVRSKSAMIIRLRSRSRLSQILWDRFGLRRLLRLVRSTMSAIRPRGRGTIWLQVTVRPSLRPAQTLTFDFVVICNGVFSIPRVPAIEGRADFAGKAFHSSDICNFDIRVDKRVVVVGIGKSALDCAALAARRGALTTLVFRRSDRCCAVFLQSIRADKLMMTPVLGTFHQVPSMTRAKAFLHGPCNFWSICGGFKVKASSGCIWAFQQHSGRPSIPCRFRECRCRRQIL